MRRLTFLATLALVAGLLLVFDDGDEAVAGHVVCGDTLTSNTRLHDDLMCSGTTLTIRADAITLDCRGHTLTGDGTGVGVSLDSVTGVTIKNCTATGFEDGFLLRLANGNTLERNTARDNTGDGFRLCRSDNITLKKNTASDNALSGFSFSGSRDSTLERNKATENGANGFDFGGGSDNTLERNTATENGADGFRFEPSGGNTLERNKATENGGDGFHLRGDVGATDRNVLVQNQARGNAGRGFGLDDGSHDNVLANNEAKANGLDGFRTASSSSDNTFIENRSERKRRLRLCGQHNGWGHGGEQDNVYVANTCKRDRAGPSDPAGLCERSGGGRR